MPFVRRGDGLRVGSPVINTAFGFVLRQGHNQFRNVKGNFVHDETLLKLLVSYFPFGTSKKRFERIQEMERERVNVRCDVSS